MNKIIKNKQVPLKENNDLNLRRINNSIEDLELNDTLMHYGVPGMKWYQKLKSRLSRSSSPVSSTPPTSPDNPTSPANPTSTTSTNSSGNKISGYDRKELVARRKEMTDKELNDAVNRLQTEKRLRELAQEDVSSGKKYAVFILKKIGKTTVESTVTAIGQGIGQKAGAKIAEAIMKKVLGTAVDVAKDAAGG